MKYLNNANHIFNLTYIINAKRFFCFKIVIMQYLHITFFKNLIKTIYLELYIIAFDFNYYSNPISMFAICLNNY